MQLESAELLLRPLQESDAQGNYPGWLNDQEVCRYNSHGETEYTRDMARDYIARVSASKSDRVFAVIHKGDQRHIGNISLQQISDRDRSAEFAILFGEKAYYNRGYSKIASRLLLGYGFSTLALHRIYCGTSVYNIPMQKLAKSLGMREEGRRMEAFLKNGEFVDIIEYGILDREFPGGTYAGTD